MIHKKTLTSFGLYTKLHKILEQKEICQLSIPKGAIL